MFVAVQQLLYLIRCSSACQQLFYFSLLLSQATAILDYHRQSSLSTTFFLFPEVFSRSAVASHAACVLTFLLSVPPHQRQLAYNSTAHGRSQYISAGFAEVGHLALFFRYCVNCANYLYNSITYHMHIINMIIARIQRDDIFDNLSMSAARSAVW